MRVRRIVVKLGFVAYNEIKIIERRYGAKFSNGFVKSKTRKTRKI